MDKGGWYETVICRYKDVELIVRVFGRGKKKIIAFHGYGQDSQVFKKLCELEEECTVYAFDLFYHGNSAHPAPEPPLSHKAYQHFMADFFRQVREENFTVIGFSMGGKYALSMADSYPQKISELVLVAPDGVRKNVWYVLATSSHLTRKIFAFLAHRPNYFFKAALWMERMKVIDGRVRKFALSQMDTPEKRARVLNSWVYLRSFFVPLRPLAKKIKLHSIKTEVIIGKYDRIITVADVKPLLLLIGDDKLTIINSGHSNILQNFIERYLRKL